MPVETEIDSCLTLESAALTLCEAAAAFPVGTRVRRTTAQPATGTVVAAAEKSNAIGDRVGGAFIGKRTEEVLIAVRWDHGGFIGSQHPRNLQPITDPETFTRAELDAAEARGYRRGRQDFRAEAIKLLDLAS